MSEGALLPPVVVRLMGDIRQLRSSMAQARTMVDGTAAGMQRAGATAFAGMAKMGKATALVGAGVAVASVKMAGDFEAQTMVLHTAAGETLKNLGTVRKGILDIASGTGTNWHNLTDGMYQVEKAGYRGAEGLKVLKAAAQGAREENARLDTVTNAMTSVMASYHLGANDSIRVMNGLKTAAGEGKMTMEQFAASLSTVLPIASANKIKFEEVAGALATLTQHGTSAREGTQELASTIRQLASPNNVAIGEMQRFGLSATDVSTKIGKRGLTGTLDLLTTTVLHKMGPSGTILLGALNKTKQAAKDADIMVRAMPKSIQGLARSYASGKISLGDWRQELKSLPPEQANLLSQYATLRNKTNGFSSELKKGGPAAKTYTDAIRKMTGGAIGLNTTLQLTGENTDGFKERVKKVGESFNHASKDVEGWKETQKLFNVQLDKAKQTIQVLAIQIGTKLLPVVISIVGWFGRHKDVAVALAAVIGGVLALSVVAYAAKLTMSAAKGVAAMAKLGAAGVKAGARVVQGFRSAQVAQSAFSGRAGSFGGALRRGFDAARSGVVSFGKAVAGATVKGGKAAWAGTIQGAKAVGSAMKTAGVAALEFSRRMLASAAAGLRAAAAWTLQKIRLIAMAVAERVAAAAQWALNLAMSANPITLIILAILAFVAILVLAYNKIAWFRNFVNSAFHMIGAAVGWVVNYVKAHWPMLLMILTGPIGIAVGLIIKHWNSIKSATSSAWRSIKSAVSSAINAVKQGISSALSAIRARWNSALSAMKGAASSIWSGIRATISSAINSAKNAVSSAVGAIGRHLASIKSKAKAALSGASSLLVGAGRDLIRGLMSGISSMAGAVAGKVRSLASHAVSAFKGALGISSPSRVFKTLGAYVMHGLVSGLTGSTARVRAATEHIARALYTSFGRGHRGLQRAVARDNAALMRLAKSRDSVAAKLKTAQKKLSDLQKNWKKERDEVAKGIMQNATVVTGPQEDGSPVNSFDVVQHMRDQVQKARQFAANLQALKKKGLRSDLISQIAAAGVDQGGDTAQALAAASKGQITEMNKLQSSMKSAANATGGAVADAMYGAGLKSAQGLVKGLKSQEKKIEDQMMRIAKSMQRAIKRALGIRSPSRVFADLGQFVPQGLAKGISDAAHHATAAASSLAGAVVGAGALGSPGIAAAGARGGGRPTIVHNHYHYDIRVAGSAVTMDQLSKDIEAAFLRRGARNSMTYQPYKR
ncbi:phage tail tape measure protein [Streptomyces sp. NPDC019937]|uniref:phage tail tape measure protein n=1 Tax=Streptomyces sp. NPDC019937 TaxID=3154787 RepID=UPI0033C1D4BF